MSEDPSGYRERTALRMAGVALALRQCVAARDQAGIALLLHGRARTVPGKHAVSIILADLLNAALGYPSTPEARAVVAEMTAARDGEAA